MFRREYFKFVSGRAVDPDPHSFYLLDLDQHTQSGSGSANECVGFNFVYFFVGNKASAGGTIADGSGC